MRFLVNKNDMGTFLQFKKHVHFIITKLIFQLSPQLGKKQSKKLPGYQTKLTQPCYSLITRT